MEVLLAFISQLIYILTIGRFPFADKLLEMLSLIIVNLALTRVVSQIGYPTASLQQRVDEKIRETRPDLRPAKRKEPTSRYPILAGDPANSVIRQLESQSQNEDL